MRKGRRRGKEKSRNVRVGMRCATIVCSALLFFLRAVDVVCVPVVLLFSAFFVSCFFWKVSVFHTFAIISSNTISFDPPLPLGCPAAGTGAGEEGTEEEEEDEEEDEEEEEVMGERGPEVANT